MRLRPPLVEESPAAEGGKPQGVAAGLEVCVVSGDKDLLQLVEQGVWVLNPWHGPPGRTTEKWYGLENAHERLGVPAERVIDYLALVGDTADNVPGVKGIGDKGALALIEKWGTVENMLAHVDEIDVDAGRDHIDVVSGADDTSRKPLLMVSCQSVATLNRASAVELQIARTLRTLQRSMPE